MKKIPRLIVFGNEKYSNEIMKYLEIMGGKNEFGFTAEDPSNMFSIDTDGTIILANQRPFKGHAIVSIETVLSIVENEKMLTTEFPRMMLVWDVDQNKARRRDIHGYIPTIDRKWIDSDNIGWKNASDIAPSIPELTIEDAEKILNRKIKRT